MSNQDPASLDNCSDIYGAIPKNVDFVTFFENENKFLSSARLALIRHLCCKHKSILPTVNVARYQTSSDRENYLSSFWKKTKNYVKKIEILKFV